MLPQAALGLNDRMVSNSEYSIRARQRFGALNSMRSVKFQSRSSVLSWDILDESLLNMNEGADTVSQRLVSS